VLTSWSYITCEERELARKRGRGRDKKFQQEYMKYMNKGREVRGL